MSHACAAIECTTVIGDDKLMCAGHWRLVPQSMQQEINRLWRAGGKGSSHDRLAALNKYRAARDAAIAHIEKLSPLI